jgi:hypothetical protein
MRSPRLLLALLAIAIAGLAVPAVSHANLKVLQDRKDADPVELVTFKTAKCRKGAKNSRLLKFHAGAKKSGYKLSVNVWERGRELDLKFGGDSPADINISGPAGSWSTLNKPSTGTGVGALHFNGKKTRLGLGFSPMFDDSLSSTISVGGALKCKYKKKRRRR